MDFLQPVLTQLKRKVSTQKGYIYRWSPSGWPPNTQTHPRPFLLLKTRPWHFPNGLQCAIFLFFRPKLLYSNFADGVKVPVSKTRWNLRLVNNGRRTGSLEVRLVLSSDAIPETRRLEAGQPSKIHRTSWIQEYKHVERAGELVWSWRRFAFLFCFVLFLRRRDKTEE